MAYARYEMSANTRTIAFDCRLNSRDTEQSRSTDTRLLPLARAPR